MDNRFMDVESAVLSLVSKSGKVLDFNNCSTFTNYLSSYHIDSPTIFDIKDEKDTLYSVFNKISNKQIRKILLNLLYRYKHSDRPNKSKCKSLIQKLIRPDSKYSNIFLHISKLSYLSNSVKYEATQILKYLNSINSKNSQTEEHAYRSLSLYSIKIVSSICSEILLDKYNMTRDQLSKISKGKRLHTVINKMYGKSKIKEINNIVNILKTDKETLNNKINRLEEINFSHRGKLINLLEDIDSSPKDKYEEVSRIIKKLNNKKSSLKNEDEAIKGCLYMSDGVTSTRKGLREIFNGIYNVRNGFDEAHGSDINDINPRKEEIILSIDLSAAISKFLINSFFKSKL